MKYYIHLLCLVPMHLCLLPNWPENKLKKKKVKAQNLYKRIKVSYSCYQSNLRKEAIKIQTSTGIEKGPPR